MPDATLAALLAALQARGRRGVVFMPPGALWALGTALVPPEPLQRAAGWRLALQVRAAYEGAGYPVHTDGQRSYARAGLVATVKGMLDTGSEG